jgi:beta-xylosidase
MPSFSSTGRVESRLQLRWQRQYSDHASTSGGRRCHQGQHYSFSPRNYTNTPSKVGDAIKIIDRDEADGPLVEAPSLVKYNGIYYLTFSSNFYGGALYDTSFATASSVTGPYTKAQAPDAPILTSDTPGLYGPGGADMWYGPNEGQGVMLFHGWNDTEENPRARWMYAGCITYDDGKITNVGGACSTFS